MRNSEIAVGLPQDTDRGGDGKRQLPNRLAKRETDPSLTQ